MFRTIRLSTAIVLIATFTCSLGMHAISPPGVRSQEFKTLPIADGYKDRRLLTPKKALKSRVLAQGFGNDQAAFLDWYSGYIFRQMTLPEHFDVLSSLRLEVQDDLRKARDPAVHRELVNLTFTAMKVLATKTTTPEGKVEQFHPWTRYNAVLLAGALNEREPNTFNINRTAALPLPEALDFLMAVLKDPNEKDSMHLAAMIGLMRHVELDRTSPQESIPPATLDELSNMMLALATAKDPPAGRTADGHVWLRRRAIDILAAIGSPGANGKIVADLDAIIADETLPVSLRCTATVALDRFNFSEPGAVDPLECAQRIGLLAAHVCRSEDLRVKAESDLAQKSAAAGASSGSFAGFGGFGGGESSTGGGDSGYGATEPTAPVDFRREHSIRRLKKALDCTLLGLRGEKIRTSIGGLSAPQDTGPGGIAQLATDDQQRDAITKIEAALETLLAVTNVEETTTLDEMMKDLRLKTVALESLLPRKPAIAEEKPAEDDPKKATADEPGRDEPGRGPDEPGRR